MYFSFAFVRSNLILPWLTIPNMLSGDPIVHSVSGSNHTTVLSIVYTINNHKLNIWSLKLENLSLFHYCYYYFQTRKLFMMGDIKLRSCLNGYLLSVCLCVCVSYSALGELY